MCSHVFCGLLLATCSNYPLKRTTTDIPDQYVKEAVEVVGSNFYVDDLWTAFLTKIATIGKINFHLLFCRLRKIYNISQCVGDRSWALQKLCWKWNGITNLTKRFCLISPNYIWLLQLWLVCQCWYLWWIHLQNSGNGVREGVRQCKEAKILVSRGQNRLQ